MIIMKKENKKTKGIIMKKTFFKKLFTASIAAITALSVFRGVPTFAETVVNTPTADQDITVSIRKTLNIAEGITTPNATFSFQFTPKQVAADGVPNSQTVPVVDITNIPNRTVSYGKDDVLEAGRTNIQKESDNIFKDVTYRYAGEYVYDVSESKTGWTAITKDNQNIDEMKYDESKYEMHVFVKNKKNGQGTYISTVYFKTVKNDLATTEKKNSETSKTFNFTFDLFTNTYRKNAGKITDPNDPTPNNPNPDHVNPKANSLVIKKIISGDLASKTKDFTFKITFKKGSTDETGVFRGKVGDKDFEFRDGEMKEFTLHHDQTLVFETLPAGTRYSLVESGTPGYTASASWQENGVAKTQQGTQATDFSLNNLLVGEKPNDNTITNTLPDVTPTGLLIDNLPFILMIGLGLAGFVVLSKKRREV